MRKFDHHVPVTYPGDAAVEVEDVALALHSPLGPLVCHRAHSPRLSLITY